MNIEDILSVLSLDMSGLVSQVILSLFRKVIAVNYFETLNSNCEYFDKHLEKFDGLETKHIQSNTFIN